ncbi:uncharacterized protein DC041_0001887 [Schistosoma bovis]|uniref:Uncharacterized protein n=1 Tax=Schistosoma bovis TaxID=6184 RepID=A0A430Q880_SCHBO|nr:uncharacterized protein DC041_0001887 [Schistosoma bovis]
MRIFFIAEMVHLLIYAVICIRCLGWLRKCIFYSLKDIGNGN